MASSRLVVSASADGAFDSYTPGVAFLFPGQGAQYVGMAKVRLFGCEMARQCGSGVMTTSDTPSTGTVSCGGGSRSR